MELIKIGKRESKVAEVEEPTIEDVKNVMRNLKNYKAAGTDGVHKRIDKVRNRIYELVRQIWKEERIPEERNETTIVRIYKKMR